MSSCGRNHTVVYVDEKIDHEDISEYEDQHSHFELFLLIKRGSTFLTNELRDCVKMSEI